MSKLGEKIAEAMPELSHLRCEHCGIKKDLNEADVARYFSSGWPLHCGYTMKLITKAEEEQLLKQLGGSDE